MQELITAPELADLLAIPERKAAQILRTVNAELQRDGFLVLNTRPLKAPRSRVMERLGLKNDETM